ncbi:hypothetical protein F511_24015 [Dorcoceras hygrometricum]|uniref:Uncharacterized protein n=1 Tax=Dorcoceras hygrometricum TaxID=472368 RepID=A0A2Z7AXP1_9LAMI|nr:hypothetical protein F511_24015 [Dorcoceras hygrometricum]
MVVDLIGIYGLKGPYCTLTTTNWFLQALSVIPRGSWGDVARRSYHDPLGRSGIVIPEPQCLGGGDELNVNCWTRARWAGPSPVLNLFNIDLRDLIKQLTTSLTLNLETSAPPLLSQAAAARLRPKIVSGQFDEENPFVLISSVLLVQADEGVSFLVVDRIGDIYRNLPRRADVIVTTVGARHKCQQGSGFEPSMNDDICIVVFRIDRLPAQKDKGLPIEQPCTSTFLDASVGSGAVLEQFYSMAMSTCWVRPLVLIDGVWTPIQGNDFLRSSCKMSLFVNRKKLSKSVVEEEFVPHCYIIEPVQYWGAAPSLIKTWGWARLCTDIIRYHLFGCFRPVREDICTDITVYNLGVERFPADFLSIFAQGMACHSFVDLIVQLDSADIQSIQEFESASSDGSTVYRSPSPILQEDDSSDHDFQFALGSVIPVTAQEEQLYCVESPESPPPIPQRQESPSSSSDSQMNFDSNDIPLDDTTEAQTSLPAAPVDLSPLLDDLKTSLSQCMDNAHSDILSRLHTIERGLQNTLGHQNDYFRNLIQGARQEGQIQDDIQILRLNELKKTVMAQIFTTDTDSLAIRNRFNALDAKILLLDGQVAAIRSEQLEFQAKISADLLSLSTQIGDLVDYIRGGDAKKGEGSSSRRPLPTPVNQGESSGNDVRTTVMPRIIKKRISRVRRRRFDIKRKPDEGKMVPAESIIRQRFDL